MNNDCQKEWPRVALWLLFILAAALLLRLIGLEKESLWWDEYATHVHLDAPSLWEFLTVSKALDPLLLPLYPILEYLWHHYVHESVLALRLLGIMLGLALIPLVYALGNRLYGSRAGLFAAALVALSPTHIHHSQGIRMYVLFMLLAGAAFWSFVRLVESPRPARWAVHGALSFLMYWTHPFAALATAALGAFLLLQALPVPRRHAVLTTPPDTNRPTRVFFFSWTAFQAALLAPSAVYLSQVRFWPQETTTEWILPPSLGALMADLFFDDISAFHWQFHLSEIALWLGPARLVFDVLFAGLTLCLLLFLAARLVSKNTNDQPRQRRFSLLLFLWLIVPPVMLFAASWIARPCMFPRYTAHCIIALYLLLGAAAGQVRTRHWRILTVGVLAGLVFLQWAWLQPGPQRTDWRSAGLLLHDQVGNDDIVLVESLLWRDVFVHNTEHLTPGRLPVPVAAAEKTSLLAAQAVLCQDMLTSPPETEPAPRVWAVIALDYFDEGPPVDFEGYLDAQGISFTRWLFPAIRSVYVYRMNPATTAPPASVEDFFARWDELLFTGDPERSDLDHHAMQAFGDLATELARHGRRSMALEILDGLFRESAFARQVYGNLRQAVANEEEVDSKASAIRALWDGYGFRDNRQPDHMRRAFAKAVALDPEHAIANFELGLELARGGAYPAAREALSRVIACDASYRDMLTSLLDGLATGRDVPEKIAAVTAYRMALLAIADNQLATATNLLNEALAHDPSLAAAQLMLGYVLTTENQYTGADAVLRQYLDKSDSPDVDAVAHMALIHAENDRPEQVLETLETLFDKSPTARQVYGPLLRAIQEEGDLKQAARAIRAFWRGFDLRGQGRGDEALEAFAQAVDLDPANAYAAVELGLELARAGKFDEAAAALKQAVDLEPAYRDMLANLTAALMRNETPTEYLEAVSAYRNGLAALGRGEQEQAEALFERALELDSRLPAAQLMLGFLLTGSDHFERADEALEQYLAISDTPDIDAYAHMALIQAEQNRADLVVETLKRLFEKNPEARNVYGSLMKAAESNEGIQQAAASIRAMWEGFDARARGREDAALEAFDQAVQLDPHNGQAALELGLGHTGQGNREEATAILKHAAALDSEYRAMLQYLLQDLGAGENTDAALKAVRAYRRGLLAQSRGGIEDAVEALAAAIDADARLDAAHTSLTFNLILLGRHEEAETRIETYLAGTDAPEPGAYGFLALFHIKRHETEAARKAVQTAFSVDQAYQRLFGPFFHALLEEHDYQKVSQEMDILNEQGIDLRTLMHDLVVDYLENVSTEPRDLEAEKAESRWQPAIAAFVRTDTEQEPQEGGLLMTGSSTARLWDLDTWFPGRPALNRGFGGSQFVDVALFAGEIIGPHKPEVIVLYAGDNDIAAGKPPRQVAEEGMTAIENLRKQAPQSRIIVIGIKPSGARWEQYPLMQQANALLSEHLQDWHGDAVYVDLGPLLLLDDGTPDPEAFAEDRLHLSSEGYRRWSEALEAVLQ